MDTRELLNANFTAIEKRYKKGKDKELTPAEKQMVADKEAAKLVVRQCCGQCSNAGVKTGFGAQDEVCSECYSIYNEKTKRFWISRYKRIKE